MFLNVFWIPVKGDVTPYHCIYHFSMVFVTNIWITRSKNNVGDGLSGKNNRLLSDNFYLYFQ